MKLYEIRYRSEMFGTFALFGRYGSIEAARVALCDFYRRAKSAGLSSIANTMRIV